jgi:hypothetical protein
MAKLFLGVSVLALGGGLVSVSGTQAALRIGDTSIMSQISIMSQTSRVSKPSCVTCDLSNMLRSDHTPGSLPQPSPPKMLRH